MALTFGSLGSGTVHLCIDMQNLFAEQTDWHVPWMRRVLPVAERIAVAHPDKTIFTRFMPPVAPDEAKGMWRRYYRRWRHMTRDRLEPRLLELLPPLAALLPVATMTDKQHYSPFSEPQFPKLLRACGADALVITGGETDVCILATVLDAVDAGYRVVLASDGVCSVSDEMHDALLRLYSDRFSEQIETASSDEILDAWSK